MPSYDMSYDSTALCREASGKARAPCAQQLRQPAASRTERISTDVCASTWSCTTPSFRHPAWGVLLRRSHEAETGATTGVRTIPPTDPPETVPLAMANEHLVGGCFSHYYF